MRSSTTQLPDCRRYPVLQLSQRLESVDKHVAQLVLQRLSFEIGDEVHESFKKVVYAVASNDVFKAPLTSVNVRRQSNRHKTLYVLLFILFIYYQQL